MAAPPPVLAMKSSFQFQLTGYTPANRDATIKLINTTTGAVVERKPFLDGSLFVRDLDPGPYELEVRHPNVLQPIDRRVIRLFPQPFPTRVNIPVPADLFRDTPIRDIPDANLTPVQQTAAAVAQQVAPLGAKSAGEVIRAGDWNQLVTAVADLANAVMQLTNLVAPRGHDHPEIAEKIDEVQGNLRRFADAFGKSLLELRREIESQKVRRQVTDVLDSAGVPQDDVRRVRIIDQIADIEASVFAAPDVFTRKLATLGTSINEVVNSVAEEQDDTIAFLGKEEVQVLTGTALQYATSGRQSEAEGELSVYRRAASKSGGKTLQFVLNR